MKILLLLSVLILSGCVNKHEHYDINSVKQYHKECRQIMLESPYKDPVLIWSSISKEAEKKYTECYINAINSGHKNGKSLETSQLASLDICEDYTKGLMFSYYFERKCIVPLAETADNRKYLGEKKYQEILVRLAGKDASKFLDSLIKTK